MAARKSTVEKEMTPVQQETEMTTETSIQQDGAVLLEKLVQKEPEPEVQKEESFFQRLRKIDVGDHIEKKNGLSYLSWAYAVDLLYQNDPTANYEFLEPTVYPDGSMMVWCKLTAFGKTTTQYLPVMDFKNKSVTNPSATDINKAMQRCLAKAIAVGTGLGLYIYRGEDIPVEETSEKNTSNKADIFKDKFKQAKTMQELKDVFLEMQKTISQSHPDYSVLFELKEQRKKELM